MWLKAHVKKSTPAATQLDDTSYTTSSSSGALSQDANANSIDRDPARVGKEFDFESSEEQPNLNGDARALVEAEAKRAKRDKLRDLDKV